MVNRETRGVSIQESSSVVLWAQPTVRFTTNIPTDHFSSNGYLSGIQTELILRALKRREKQREADHSLNVITLSLSFNLQIYCWHIESLCMSLYWVYQALKKTSPLIVKLHWWGVTILIPAFKVSFLPVKAKVVDFQRRSFLSWKNWRIIGCWTTINLVCILSLDLHSLLLCVTHCDCPLEHVEYLKHYHFYKIKERELILKSLFPLELPPRLSYGIRAGALI